MADLPLPGQELTPDAGSAPVDPAPAIPAAVHGLLVRLWSAGHAAYVVGGSLRDTLRGREPADWDLATAALPEVTQALLHGSVYENAFGTVAVRTDDPAIGEVEITTFRSDHDYADHRRPHRVEFTDSIDLDLARRDFTVNAIAWGAESGARPAIVDPHRGLDDLATATLRAVGDPPTRFEEDALRMVRAVRLAATLEFTIEPATRAAIEARAELVRHLSGERIAEEMRRLLAAAHASVGLHLAADTGLLAHLAPELDAQRGVPQNKVPGEDLWHHVLRSVDGAVVDPPHIRLAALLHDIGKPATMADGRFVGHETAGAEMARDLLERWRWPTAERDRVVLLIRQHMFGYVPTWSDTAVRRFIVKVGRDALDDLFLLREADNVGSGRAADAGGLGEFRARVRSQLESGAALDLAGLAVDGTDLMAEFGWEPGPVVGSTLQRLLERVIGDPTLNTRDRLLAVARSMVATDPGIVIELLLEAERALSFGRVERAEELYRQVAAADPHNSIAVVGLARVALERADDLGAYRLAREALAIDPENEAALRLARRLEEVLATRGEPVPDPMAAEEPQPPPPFAAPAETPSPTEAERRSILDRLRRR